MVDPSSETYFGAIQTFFNDQSSAYEKQTGGITRKYVRHILERAPPVTSESVVHDNACGPGIVTEEILKRFEGESLPRIWGTDSAEGMVKLFQRMIDAKGWAPAVTAEVMDGSDLSAIPDNTFTHSITNFGLFVFSDPLAAVKHIRRTLKPGGHASITIWSHQRQLNLIHSIVHAIRPEQPEFWPILKSWLDKDWILDLFSKAGFEAEDVKYEAIADSGKFESGEEFKSMQKNGWLKLVREGWSDEENERFDGVCWELMTEREKEGWFDMAAHVFTLRKNEK